MAEHNDGSTPEMIAGHEIHPAASIFPMLTASERKELADDIKKNGQRHPILRDTKGRVFDGRNRLLGAADAGIEPRFEVIDLDDDAIFERVVSENVHRRHLSDAQRAVVGAKLVLALRARGAPDGRASARVGEQLGVSSRTIDEALAVVSKGAEGLPELVANGEVGVSVAATVARASYAVQQEAVAAGPGAVRGLAKQLKARRADLRTAGGPQPATRATDAEDTTRPGDAQPADREADIHASRPHPMAHVLPMQELRIRYVAPTATGTPTSVQDDDRPAERPSTVDDDEAPVALDLDDAVPRAGHRLDRHQSHQGARLVLELDEHTYQRWSRRLRTHDLAAAAFALLEEKYEAANG